MLITLVIIGIIAALTIPNLMQKYQEQTTVKKVQKFYSTLSNAYNLAIKDNGTPEDWGIVPDYVPSAIKIYEILFKPYFKITKNCGLGTTGNCLANVEYKYLNNTNGINYAASGVNYQVALSDGATIFFNRNSDPSLLIGVGYDVNGPKGPNQWGVDYFYFHRPKDRITPLGLISESYNFNTYCKKNTTDSFSGYGCAAWVVYKGNMDYLHCDGLTWKSRSCKDK